MCLDPAQAQHGVGQGCCALVKGTASTGHRRGRCHRTLPPDRTTDPTQAAVASFRAREGVWLCWGTPVVATRTVSMLKPSPNPFRSVSSALCNPAQAVRASRREKHCIFRPLQQPPVTEHDSAVSCSRPNTATLQENTAQHPAKRLRSTSSPARSGAGFPALRGRGLGWVLPHSHLPQAAGLVPPEPLHLLAILPPITVRGSGGGGRWGLWIAVMVGGVCSSLDWSSLVLSFLSPCEQCCCRCG